MSNDLSIAVTENTEENLLVNGTITDGHDGNAAKHESDDQDLNEMELGVQTLLEENTLSEREASEIINRVKKARKSFRELSPEQRKKVVSSRVVTGTKMFESTLRGNSALVIELKLEHGVLKNRFSQFVPFLDRALVNMKMFGDESFGTKNNKQRLEALIDGTQNFYETAKAARIVAEERVAQVKRDFDAKEEVYYELQVPKPAIEGKIHIHSKHSLTHLNAYLEFDRLQTAITWLEWHGAITKDEVDETMKSINKLALDVGRRGFLTFVELGQMRDSNQRSPAPQAKVHSGTEPLAA